MPGPLITQKDISSGAISYQKRDFDTRNSKSQEARVFFSFSQAGVPVSMPHALSKKPTTFTVVASGISTGLGAPKVYAKDPVYWATRNVIVLSSDTANSWAEVIIR